MRGLNLYPLFTPDSKFVVYSIAVVAVETLGEAWQLGWRITARYAFGNNDGMRSCIYQYDLDAHLDARGRVSAFQSLDQAQVSQLRIAQGCSRLSHATRAADGAQQTHRMTVEIQSWSILTIILYDSAGISMPEGCQRNFDTL